MGGTWKGHIQEGLSSKGQFCGSYARLGLPVTHPLIL